jgi:uncharacterized repeat protein (TIGR01451 family)
MITAGRRIREWSMHDRRTAAGRRRPHCDRLLPGALLLAAVVSLMSVGPARGQTLPPGFQETVVFSGLTQPTAVEFTGDGRVFVAEKSGLIKVFDSLADTTPTVFADLRTQVHNFWDRGLLGLALHPDFPTSPWVYALYTHDAAIGGVAPRWGSPGVTSDPCPTPPGPTADGCVVSGRLSRLEASGNVMIGSERVLLEDWCQQYPSHSVGALAFGPDGALYVSGGDGASFNFVDYGQDGSPLNPCGAPPAGVGGVQTPPTAEGGALSSQSLRSAYEGPATLNGAVLRVNPETGAAMPDNPLVGSPDPNAQRIVAYGLRNPFRLTVRPGTNEIWVGDVGWGTWEEINRITNPTGGVANLGWPCYEGNGRQPGYDSANLNLCETLYQQPGLVVTPHFTYNHSSQVVAGESCPTGSSSISGLAFYTGTRYPAAYNGALFFADYSRGCIWVMKDPLGTRTIESFVFPAAAVALRTGHEGDVFWVDYNGGTIRRIQYVADNQPPTAVVQAAPTTGETPLTVNFDGRDSSDPDAGDTLSYSWDLNGDGVFGDSTSATAAWTYSAAGNYTARLRVTDSRGASDTADVVIRAGTRPVARIDTPSPSLTWRVGDVITFSGGATDAEEGTLPPSALTWTIILHHCPSNCHTHTIQSFPGVTGGTFVAPDHEYPSHLEIRLTATDSAGLTDSRSVLSQPQTAILTFQSSPSGLQLAVNGSTGTTPFPRTVIIGSSNSVSAPSPQTLGGVQYQFSNWSDGGAQTHNITGPASPASYSANYAAAPSADLGIVNTAESSSPQVTFTLRVSNQGTANASNVVVTDVLAGKLEFVSASAGCTYTSATRQVTCQLGSLAANASQTVQITTRAKGAGFVENTAQVTSSTPDPQTANNQSTSRVRVR